MISLYLQDETWAHRISARMKLAVLAAISILLFPADDIALLGAVLAGCLLLYWSLGKSGLRQLVFLKPLLVFFVVILALHGLSGTWLEGVTILLRLAVMVLLANFVSVTTRMDDMIEAVRPLFAPLALIGASPRKPALAVALVLRFAPVLLSVYVSLAEAYRARSGRKGSWRLIAPFALQALRMSENVAEALTARGGAGGVHPAPGAFEHDHSARFRLRGEARS